METKTKLRQLAENICDKFNIDQNEMYAPENDGFFVEYFSITGWRTDDNRDDYVSVTIRRVRKTGEITIEVSSVCDRPREVAEAMREIMNDLELKEQIDLYEKTDSVDHYFM